MIDVESQVFDYVRTAIGDVLPEGSLRSVFVPDPVSFPCATLMEMDNTVNQRMRTSADTEDFSDITYEVNVYALTKGECRTVLSAIDDAMNRLNFVRFSMQAVPNLQDRRIYRMVARYQATVSAEHVLHRR